MITVLGDYYEALVHPIEQFTVLLGLFNWAHAKPYYISEHHAESSSRDEAGDRTERRSAHHSQRESFVISQWNAKTCL